jgi:hypothetical protein
LLGNKCSARFLEGQLGMAVFRLSLNERRLHLLHQPFGFLSGLAFSGERVLGQGQAIHGSAKMMRATVLDRSRVTRSADCRTCGLKA